MVQKNRDLVSSATEGLSNYTKALTSASRAISVLSVHVLPNKGFDDKMGKLKAYSTLLGGFLYMAVSKNINIIKSFFSHNNCSYLKFLCILVFGMSVCRRYNCALFGLIL